MSDFEKVLKDFGIPKLDEVSLNDQILLTEYLKTQNPMYIAGVILRMLRDNKAISGEYNSIVEISKSIAKINDDLFSLTSLHDKRIEELEEKIGNMYSFQDISKKLNWR